jgi:lipopolysaccharide/colanic/teichoic acid biosynthesis glycosyltransferase
VATKRAGAWREPFAAAVRRALDVVLAIALLLLIVLVFMLAAAAVRLSGPGPVIFRQERLGRDGRPFRLAKFRTMVMNNDDSAHRQYVTALLTQETPPDGGQAGVYKIVHDPRVTPVGRFLRATSLDELPQLWNVIRGEMALVGPRPVLPWEAALFPDWASKRFDVRPGITGLWQVSGRSRVGMMEALRLDIAYVEQRSVWLDLSIVLRTSVVLFGRSSAK